MKGIVDGSSIVQKSAFTRAGLLAYRKKAGKDRYIEMIKKLEEEKSSHG